MIRFLIRFCWYFFVCFCLISGYFFIGYFVIGYSYEKYNHLIIVFSLLISFFDGISNDKIYSYTSRLLIFPLVLTIFYCSMLLVFVFHPLLSSIIFLKIGKELQSNFKKFIETQNNEKQ
jgi:hypothetical protein